MKLNPGSILAALLLFVGPTGVEAQLVTWHITGTVQSLSPELEGAGVSADSPLNCSITYDLSVPPTLFTDQKCYFNLTSMTLSAGDLQYSGSAGYGAVIALYEPFDSTPGTVVIETYPRADLNGHSLTDLKFQLDSPTAAGMTPYLTATDAPIVADFSSHDFTFYYDMGAYGITGDLTGITVPEPSSLGLASLIAALGWSFYQSKHRATVKR